MRRSPAATYVRLARWLGPWASEAARPPGVDPIEVAIAAPRPLRAWLYRPAGRARGAYLIAPGLHYAGPADRRMDRFCRILAAAGILVLAPFLPDYTDLRVDERSFDDFERSWDALRARPELPRSLRPGVFSISFGSLLALRLAGVQRPDEIGALVVFGGYADWQETIRFCLTGEAEGAHVERDPLNQPVVFINLIDHLEGAPADPAPLLRAWRRYVEATWGRPEMKRDGRHLEIARRHAAEVPEDARELFLVGCGVEPGGHERVRAALARAGTPAFLDPLPHVRNIRCPVHLVHGVDDDVIPHAQSARLAAALPASALGGLHLTGLYGHTSTSSLTDLVRSAPLLARELSTMGRILRAIVTAAAHR